MEPLKGGALVRLPEEAANILKEANPNEGERFLGNPFCSLSGSGDGGIKRHE